MSDLQEYYRHAVAARVTEIEGAHGALTSDRSSALTVIRRAAHSLRGSGGTYGFPEVSTAAAAVEDADESDPAAFDAGIRHLLEVLRGVTAQATGKARILIVDDDPEIALLLRTVLARTDREVSTAPSAAAADALLESTSFDVVLLDLLLPDADGRTVLRTVMERARTPRPHVIVLSGKTAGATKAECLALGADVYIEKPFDPEAVADHVTRQLERLR